MKNVVKKNIFGIVLVLLLLPILDSVPFELSDESEFVLSVTLTVIGFASFLAAILVFWAAYYAHGRLVATIAGISYFALPVINEYLYFVVVLSILLYWVSLKKQVRQFANKT
ncbi:hypothetical protein CWC22_011280 [Pseudoalteromonas rubra]|uniref:Uncharacterized protein n=1 Tax=Pseudoalteromonas rubra TaxID=43658 RepID=A0A5S3V3P0_9GAMM|nr:hypothetical protein [Pseudoalteromonas rubra]QPB83537.1 hypothetical protein CWC22_011280 [Pseudoalteromonas rubra]